MRRAYRRGLATALNQWRLVLLVFFVGLLGGLAFMACAWIWLAQVLDSSLETRTLATSIDAHVIIDIMAHHDSEIWMLAYALIPLAAAGLCLGTWTNALIVTAVTAESGSLVDSIRRAAGKYRSFLLLLLLVGLCDAAVIGAAFVGWSFLDDWASHRSDELTRYWVLAACTLAGSTAVLLITATHDHARIRCLETADGAGRAFLWAWGYVLREPRTIALAFLLLATFAAVWLPYQTAGRLLPATSTIGLTLSLVWAQMFMVARSLLRVWAFAAAAALQGSTEAFDLRLDDRPEAYP
jgi:hypothetical protein